MFSIVKLIIYYDRFMLKNLKSRLLTCSCLVDSPNILDVGTDHAKLPIYLVSHGIVSKAFACDINPYSVKRSIDNVNRHNLGQKIKVFLSDGLKNVDKSLSNTIVIAGLGGKTISEIISCCPWKITEDKDFILQPTKSESHLRVFLEKNKFKIDRELAVNDGKYSYSTMLVHFAGHEQKNDDLYPWVGKLSPCKESYNYISKQIRYIEKFLYGMKCKNHVQQKEKLEILLNKLKKFLFFCK